ncbi:hypothetical protein HanIR_Chr06g0297641 [Helianthus annuus]|nr:hypothetical protein HanIR_Chr06g0297641 [Helianthus annuus]
MTGDSLAPPSSDISQTPPSLPVFLGRRTSNHRRRCRRWPVKPPAVCHLGDAIRGGGSMVSTESRWGWCFNSPSHEFGLRFELFGSVTDTGLASQSI